MLKKFILYLFIFLISMPSWASDKIITYEDFVHFNRVQKIATIKVIHRFLIEYESLGNISKSKVKTKKKYQSYLKIMDLIISSAHAAEETPSMLPKINDEERAAGLCYYAGWLSVQYTDDRKLTTCKHPKKLKKHLARTDLGAGNIEMRDRNRALLEKVSNRYQAGLEGKSSSKVGLQYVDGKFIFVEDDKSCSSPKSIICNPDMYGTFKGEEICVPGNSNFGINSSLMCSKAIEVIKELDEKNKTDEYKNTMNVIIKAAEDPENNEQFFYTLRSMYDTCLCGQNSADFSNSINSGYANKLFYTRTCFGILNQTQYIKQVLTKQDKQSKTCEYISKNPINSTSLQTVSWLNYLNKADSVLAEQKMSSSIDKMIKDRETWSKSFDRQINRDDVLEYSLKESAQFRNQRNKHFEQYKEVGLCPLGSELKNKPAGTPAVPEEAKEKTYTLSLTRLSKGELAGKVSLVRVIILDKKDEDVTEKFIKTVKFKVAPIEGAKPPVQKAKPATVEATTPDTAVATDTAVTTGGAAATSPSELVKTEGNPNEYSYTVNHLEAVDQTAVATLTIGDETFTDNKKIPMIAKTEPEKVAPVNDGKEKEKEKGKGKSCGIKLASRDDGKGGYIIETTITLDGKAHTSKLGDETELGTGDKSFKITWFDEGKSNHRNPTNLPGKEIDDHQLADDSVETKPKTKKSDDKDIQNIIKNFSQSSKFNAVKEKDKPYSPFLVIGGARRNTKQKIAAIIEHGECSSSSTVEIPALAQQQKPGPNNGSSIKLNLKRGKAARGGGVQLGIK